MCMKMNILVSWVFITVMITTAKGKGKSTDKPANEYAYSKEEQFSSPDVFWPIHSSLHGNGAPASSITALLHSVVVGMGEGNLGAAELTGTSDSYIQIPNTGDLDGREAFCWIFNLYPTSSQTATILEYAGIGGTGNGVKLTQEGRKLVATVYDVTGKYYDEYRRNILTINAWNLVGFSYNKVWGIIDIFKDDDIHYTITGITMKDVNAVGDVTIGRSVDGTGNFEGKVSCIQFFKKALFNKALNNPPTYCDLSIWDPSVLDWTGNFIQTGAAITSTTITTSTTTTTTTSTTATTTTSTTTTSTTTSSTPTITTQTTTTTPTPTPTPIVTPATATTPIVTTTTVTTTPTTTPIPALTTPTTTTIAPIPATSASSATTMPSTITISANTATATSSTGTATHSTASGTTLKETTTPVLTSATTQAQSSLGLSQTSTQPQTSGFLRGDQPTLTDTCYFLTIWVRNHDFQSPGDVITMSNNRTLTECVHMCTGNPKCLVFVFHDNGECKVGATSSPSLWTTATMSSRVYRLVSMDTNKYFYAP